MTQHVLELEDAVIVDRDESGLGVKARRAQPSDAAIKADQRRRRTVTDQPHILEREITIASAHRAKRTISVKHGLCRRRPSHRLDATRAGGPRYFR